MRPSSIVRERSAAHDIPATNDFTWASLSISFPPARHAPTLDHQQCWSASPELCSSKSPSSALVPSGAARLIPPLIPYLSEATHPVSTLTITFPLSPDHHLLTLMQYNVLRATMTNLAILSLLDALPIECCAARHLITLLPTPDSIPPSFQPTPLQLAIPHDFWIDALPIREMRDNLIRLQGEYDQDELCLDLCGGLYEGFDEIEIRGILVWGDPWRADGWEVTEGFVRKWGFILKGCGSLIDATNRWRMARGEERLVFEV